MKTNIEFHMRVLRLNILLLIIFDLVSAQSNQPLPLVPTGTEPQTPILYREYVLSAGQYQLPADGAT